MEPKFRTSFIPKKTLAAATVEKRRAGSLGILSLLALTLALGAVVLSVGTFLYAQLLDASITRKSETLTRAQAAFEPALIRELVRLDSRIKEAEGILDEHLSPSAFFEELEGLTLKSVRFSEFSLTRIGEGRISISMKGVADDFSGVALQADIFGKSRMIREPIFSNLNINQEGRAVFNVTAILDPSELEYTEQVAAGSLNIEQ
ncbi:MAG: hypothetical protein OQJ98_00470 [Candidatus Pacebacteria bacterium]|nr:hypothetical protein [Candidatus Paceibacterota bacterium]